MTEYEYIGILCNVPKRASVAQKNKKMLLTDNGISVILSKPHQTMTTTSNKNFEKVSKKLLTLTFKSVMI
ncbi:hypothetical protein GCM10019993_21180 [Enterococcus pseudoavium]